MKQDTVFGTKPKRPLMSNVILAAGTLWKREIVRFYRQPSRVVGALASPFLFWILIGSGIGSSFHSGDLSAQKGYLGYFFPGTLLLTLFFTAVFSTISLIEDRKEGFLQAVLVAPVPRFSIVLGKVLGGSTLAFIQAMLFLVLAPYVGIKLAFLGWVRTALIIFLNAFLMTSLGFLIAWQFQSIQGFHAVMNLLLMPMWILSGSLFPPEGASIWIQWIMKINPLTYGLSTMRISLFSYDIQKHLFMSGVCYTVIFSAALFFLASFLAKTNKAGDLR